MKIPLPRRQQLTNAIDEITNQKNIITNPLLASYVYEHNYSLKFTDLANFHSFSSISATDSEIMSKFSYIPQKDFTISSNNEIHYNFTFKSQLYISKDVTKEHRTEFQKFAQRITNSDVKLSFFNNLGCYLITFIDFKHLFAFWRALTYVPFQNKLITASIVTVPNEQGQKFLYQQATTPTIHTSPFKVVRKTNQTIKFEIGKRLNVPDPSQAQDV